MPKGKPWTKEEVEKLRKLLKADQPLEVVAAELKRTSDAVKKKCKRLGLEVVGAKGYRTTTLKLPKELPSVEEALKILAGALEKASECGLDKVEVQRLQVIATLARTYKEILADYINYREIEKELVKWRARYEELARKKS
jgi:hypothetical protein